MNASNLPPPIAKAIERLAELILAGEFEPLETDTLEIKPVPSDSGSWNEIEKTACAFLNTRGGVLILGVREEPLPEGKRYRFEGWRGDCEPKLKNIAETFEDGAGTKMDVGDQFPPPMIVDFLQGKLALLFVDELPADRKYAFHRRNAYRRVLTGDHRISPADIEFQEEFKHEALQARELGTVKGTTLDDIDLDKLNNYITHINRPLKIESIKADLQSAIPFLLRKQFIVSNTLTYLGCLVCARHPEDILGFRCQLHGYVDFGDKLIAADKQDFSDNIIQLMESAYSFTLRSIQVGVSVARSGTSVMQYPEELLRETINNALAHRDYSIDRHVILTIRPGKDISIKNPGLFRDRLLLTSRQGQRTVRRIIPEAKARNPKLADVLRVFRKWEGKGIGMSTMVNMCLDNRIDVPFYRFETDSVDLHIPTGHLVDSRMEDLFRAFDRYITSKTEGRPLTDEQKKLLAYLIKSERLNSRFMFTILLSPDNNHFGEIAFMEKVGLIALHESSTSSYPVYVVDPVLLQDSYSSELNALFGDAVSRLDSLQRQVLDKIYRFDRYSSVRFTTAKLIAFTLWHEEGGDAQDIKAFDAYYRKVRRVFNKLQEKRFIHKNEASRHYLLSSRDYFDGERHSGFFDNQS